MGGYGGSMRPFIGYQWNRMGGGIIYRYRPRGSMRGADRSFLEHLAEMPLNSNLMGRFIRSSGYGLQEQADRRRDVSKNVSARLSGRENHLARQQVETYLKSNPDRVERLKDFDRIGTDIATITDNVLQEAYPNTQEFNPRNRRGWSDDDIKANDHRLRRAGGVKNMVQNIYMNANGHNWQRDWLGDATIGINPSEGERADLLSHTADTNPSNEQFAREVLTLVAYQPNLIPSGSRSRNTPTLVEYLSLDNLNRLRDGLLTLDRRGWDEDREETIRLLRGLNRRR